LSTVDQQGEYVVPASQDVVWQALNDPAVLAQCIPGCQSMEKLDDTRFSAKVRAKVGPVSATFDVMLELADIEAPRSYRIEGQVKGGPAGFGKGGARVQLEASGPRQTRLTYKVEASVGGKLAQVGSRLIDAAVRKMADEFFSAFSSEVGTPDSSKVADEAAASPNADAQPSQVQPRFEASSQWKVWAVVFAIFVLAMLLAL
jgi:carbon monoxide dehydrogenase subunit G